MDKLSQANAPIDLLNKRRQFLGRAAALMALPVVSKVASATTSHILAVRTWPADEYTRITLELSTPIHAEHFLLHHPERLVLDLKGLSMGHALNSLMSKIKPNDPYIGAVRVAQNRADVVRLVLDLKQTIVPQVFTLKPVGRYKYRFVVDLYPKVAHDPIASLSRQMSKNDPLSDILDSIAQNQPITPVPRVRGQVVPNLSTPSPNIRIPKGRRRAILVAIDPGHGGEDPGAIGSMGTREKDIVLKIGKNLHYLINREPNMRAYMTRDSDFFVPLGMRVQKARRVRADVFVSIHADAFTNRSAKGTSVFALSRKGASSAAARWLAKKENAADLIGGLDIAAQDANTARVLLDLSTNAQINDSLKLGHKVLGSLGKINGILSRRVEQAGFAVLKAPDIPSILVETAFISNPSEEKFLRNPSNQYRVAKGILGGLKDYLASNPALRIG